MSEQTVSEAKPREPKPKVIENAEPTKAATQLINPFKPVVSVLAIRFDGDNGGGWETFRATDVEVANGHLSFVPEDKPNVRKYLAVSRIASLEVETLA